MPGSLLSALRHEELESVVFVRDHLQLNLTGARLTLYVWPSLRIGEDLLRLGDPGYRDALCALIDQGVLWVEDSGDRGLLIRFERGDVIVRPDPAELAGPEIALLHVHADTFRDAA